ncbi:MAG: hypothetical protein NZT61_07285 [Deltaproteobacteria bacterium]|nr:hypothetical protein [Deltaproteobacteria bacterium]
MLQYEHSRSLVESWFNDQNHDLVDCLGCSVSMPTHSTILELRSLVSSSSNLIKRFDEVMSVVTNVATVNFNDAWLGFIPGSAPWEKYLQLKNIIDRYFEITLALLMEVVGNPAISRKYYSEDLTKSLEHWLGKFLFDIYDITRRPIEYYKTSLLNLKRGFFHSNEPLESTPFLEEFVYPQFKVIEALCDAYNCLVEYCFECLSSSREEPPDHILLLKNTIKKTLAKFLDRTLNSLEDTAQEVRNFSLFVLKTASSDKSKQRQIREQIQTVRESVNRVKEVLGIITHNLTRYISQATNGDSTLEYALGLVLIAQQSALELSTYLSEVSSSGKRISYEEFRQHRQIFRRRLNDLLFYLEQLPELGEEQSVSIETDDVCLDLSLIYVALQEKIVSLNETFNFCNSEIDKLNNLRFYCDLNHSQCEFLKDLFYSLRLMGLHALNLLKRNNEIQLAQNSIITSILATIYATLVEAKNAHMQPISDYAELELKEGVMRSIEEEVKFTTNQQPLRISLRRRIKHFLEKLKRRS